MKRILLLILMSPASMALTIHCGQVFDADKGRWMANQVVTIEGRKFTEIADHQPVSYTHLTLPTNREV